MPLDRGLTQHSCLGVWTSSLSMWWSAAALFSIHVLLLTRVLAGSSTVLFDISLATIWTRKHFRFAVTLSSRSCSHTVRRGSSLKPSPRSLLVIPTIRSSLVEYTPAASINESRSGSPPGSSSSPIVRIACHDADARTFIRVRSTVPRPVLTDSFVDVVTQNVAALDAAIMHHRDFDFT